MQAHVQCCCVPTGLGCHSQDKAPKGHKELMHCSTPGPACGDLQPVHDEMKEVCYLSKTNQGYLITQERLSSARANKVGTKLQRAMGRRQRAAGKAIVQRDGSHRQGWETQGAPGSSSQTKHRQTRDLQTRRAEQHSQNRGETSPETAETKPVLCPRCCACPCARLVPGCQAGAQGTQ